jgi:hypothetical protein
MSNDDLPGFIEDEPKKPAKPEKAPPAKGFNAFADVPVTDPSATPKEPSAAKPAAGRAGPPAAAPKPGTARTAKPAAPAAAAPAAAKAPGFDAFADAASQPDGNDADVKPGKGLDLWACPHCGTKNKPTRNTCRACGKSPDEPVIIAWHQKPLVKPAIAAGVVLVLVLLGWLLLGGGVRLVEAEVGNIDKAPRTAGGAGAPSELDGKAFTPRRRYAVCGRIVGVQARGNLNQLVLAVGADGRDETRVNEAGVDFSASEPVTMPELHVAVVLAFGAMPSSLEKGRIVSLLGDVGTLEGVEEPVVRIERAVP